MTEEDLKLIKECEVFLNNIYYFCCKHNENGVAVRAKVLALELARLRGYEGD